MLIRFNDAIAARRNGLKEGEKGFTLIELLVVIIIIGILAAIAIPVFLNQREAAWKASVESDLKNAAVLVETFGTSNNGSYTGFTPTTIPAAQSSEDNTITVAVNADGTAYVITGVNANLVDTGDTTTYDSATGGLTGTWN